MFGIMGAREYNDNENYMDALRKAKRRALDEPGFADRQNKVDQAYWDYAGKAAAGGNAQQIATQAEPALQALRNQGMMGKAVTEGEYDLGAADIAGQSRVGVADILGQSRLGAADMTGQARIAAADKTAGGVRDAAQIKAENDAVIARMKEDAAAGRLTVQEQGLLSRLLLESGSKEKIAGIGAGATTGAAQIRANTPRYDSFTGKLIGGVAPAGETDELSDVTDPVGSNGSYTMDELRRRYPGVSDDAIRAAAAKKNIIVR